MRARASYLVTALKRNDACTAVIIRMSKDSPAKELAGFSRRDLKGFEAADQHRKGAILNGSSVGEQWH